jgi:hypothetical protein
VEFDTASGPYGKTQTALIPDLFPAHNQSYGLSLPLASDGVIYIGRHGHTLLGGGEDGSWKGGAPIYSIAAERDRAVDWTTKENWQAFGGCKTTAS